MHCALCTRKSQISDEYGSRGDDGGGGSGRGGVVRGGGLKGGRGMHDEKRSLTLCVKLRLFECVY